MGLATWADPAMEILALEQRLDDIDRMAREVEFGEASDAALRRRGLELLDLLEQRFALEEREPLALIRALHPRGREHAERLAADRREQKLLLRFQLDALTDPRRPPALIACGLRDFASAVREDIAAEGW